MGFLRKLFDSEYKELKRFEKIADEIMDLNDEMEKLSDEKLAAKTEEFKKRLEDGEDLDDLVVEAFAVVREAAYRIIGEKPYFVQILGGLAIHYGNIAEMKTGEGKTLTETMPTYLNALTGKGVHIVPAAIALLLIDIDLGGANLLHGVGGVDVDLKEDLAAALGIGPDIRGAKIRAGTGIYSIGSRGQAEQQKQGE